MNPYINVEVNLYFTIDDSEMFGGLGSKGYMNLGACEVKPESLQKIDRYAEEQRMNVADLCGVPEEKVCFISKEEYEKNVQ